MIQGSINQLLQMAAVASKLDPNAEKRAAVYQTKSEGKLLEKQERVATLAGAKKRDAAKTPEQRTEAEAQLQEARDEYLNKRVANAKQMFDLNPTEENYKEYRYLKNVHKDLNAPVDNDGNNNNNPSDPSTPSGPGVPSEPEVVLDHEGNVDTREYGIPASKSLENIDEKYRAWYAESLERAKELGIENDDEFFNYVRNQLGFSKNDPLHQELENSRKYGISESESLKNIDEEIISGYLDRVKLAKELGYEDDDDFFNSYIDRFDEPVIRNTLKEMEARRQDRRLVEKHRAELAKQTADPIQAATAKSKKALADEQQRVGKNRDSANTAEAEAIAKYIDDYGKWYRSYGRPIDNMPMAANYGLSQDKFFLEGDKVYVKK